MRPRGFGLVASAATVAYSVAAAAGEENDGKNDQPYPVVIEQIAEAVIHSVSPFR